MIKLKNLIVGFIVLFASCSTDGEELVVSSQTGSEFKRASLFLKPVLNVIELSQDATEQELSGCSNDIPSYAMLVLSGEGTNGIGTQEDPYRIELGSHPNSPETIPEFNLVPGTYFLDFYMVFNDRGEPIWFAPNDGTLGDYLDDPLPLEIELNAGVTRYVDVSAICLDQRIVNEQGYIFFELEETELIEFCIFGNYCDETGRHFPAEFNVSVWDYADDQQGDLLVSDVNNTVALDENGDYAATPVCINLPDGEGLDEFYIELTILSSDAYGEIQEEIIRSGVITEDDVKSLFNGEENLDYYHFREGCSREDSPDFFTEESTGGE